LKEQRAVSIGVKLKCSTCTIALLQCFGYPYSFDSTFERYKKRDGDRKKETSIVKRTIQESPNAKDQHRRPLKGNGNLLRAEKRDSSQRCHQYAKPPPSVRIDELFFDDQMKSGTRHVPLLARTSGHGVQRRGREHFGWSVGEIHGLHNLAICLGQIEALNAVVFIDLNRVSLTRVSVWRCMDQVGRCVSAYPEILGVVVSCIAANALSAWF
jgi:hypothetical protein